MLSGTYYPQPFSCVYVKSQRIGHPLNFVSFLLNRAENYHAFVNIRDRAYLRHLTFQAPVNNTFFDTKLALAINHYPTSSIIFLQQTNTLFLF
jgi:hypothetical protein